MSMGRNVPGPICPGSEAKIPVPKRPGTELCGI